MELDERKIALAAAVFAVAGIALLFLLSETPREASIAEALVAPANSYLSLSGAAQNITADKFYLCQRELCISMKKGGLVSAQLVSDGSGLQVLGRVKEYKGSRYFEAESIEAK
ncbi:MAG: hypothetical protein NTX79_05625 [Candidatus Micrarchaeota archaeon]|nr:hypothetical protein [Candidatus Micrarchaeota archaeon]